MIGKYICTGSFVFLAIIQLSHPTCVLESDFGFKINCAFKKSGLFRVRNLGGIKAHASLGFSLGDELGFEQSLTNLDPSRRRSVSVKNGAPPNALINTSSRPTVKQEKRGKQNRIMMRPQMPLNSQPNPSAMESLSTLHRRVSTTMQPIIVAGPAIDAPRIKQNVPKQTMAKPMPMGLPPFKPLPPKEDTLKVLPITTTKKTYTPLQLPQSKGPGPVYQNPVPHHINDLANQLYPVYSTKKVDDYNSITGYGDETPLKVNKEDINKKIAEIAKAGNISMEAIEAAIALRQQQLLTKFANIIPPSTTTTTTTQAPIVFQTEPELVYTSAAPKQKRYPTSGKVMNAPREYYPVGYEKNFDDQFHSKVDLPDTNFHCGDQKYFPGLYGDENLGCMVFHVCALTDDGLVMKSFLCPESTLFDQTILKCNWWFYVDCKNSRKLYDTNIPVSKSYQLMKALTFFSSYKKEMQDDGGRSKNPEEIEGIKEAITILENQDNIETKSSDGMQIITPATTLKSDNDGFRINVDRSIKNKTATRTNATRNKPKSDDMEASDTVKVTNVRTVNSRESSSKETSKERVYRRRQTNRQTRTTTNKPSSTPESTTPSSNPETTTSKVITTTPKKIEFPRVIPSEINNLNLLAVQPTIEAIYKANVSEKVEKIDASILKEAENLPPRKRFYRSSAESSSKEIAYVNDEKVQVVRPRTFPKYVGDTPTPTAAISRLDDAILGKIRRKKEARVTVITPDKDKDVALSSI